MAETQPPPSRARQIVTAAVDKQLKVITEAAEALRARLRQESSDTPTADSGAGGDHGPPDITYREPTDDEYKELWDDPVSSKLGDISETRDAALGLRRDAHLLADEPYDADDAAGLWDQKLLAARQAWESSLKKNPTVAFETWDWREVGEQIRGIIDPASEGAVASGVQGPEDESPGRALLYLGALTALLLLVLSYIWVSSSGSGFSYVSTIAAAIAAAAFSFEALRTWPATRPASWRAPFAAIAPLVLLVIGFWALMLRDPRLPEEEAALAVSVILLLVGIALAATLFDLLHPIPRVAFGPVTIPEDVQNADYAQRLRSYLEQLRGTLRQHAISRKRSGWIWTGLFLGLGLLATVLSGLAGFSSASERFTDYVAILALVGRGPHRIRHVGQPRSAGTDAPFDGGLVRELGDRGRPVDPARLAA